jgi:hypothetical protein
VAADGRLRGRFGFLRRTTDKAQLSLSIRDRQYPDAVSRLHEPRIDVRMKDPFIRVKFTKEQSFARQLAKEYFEKYPKDRYQTEVESWREIQSRNIEFIMKRLREPPK